VESLTDPTRFGAEVGEYEKPFAWREGFCDKAPPLHPFALTPEGLESPVFNFAVRAGRADPALLPKYQDRSWVRAAKPGAVVLAVTRAAGGQPAKTLLAVQNYGAGRAAVLATDPLWRWRLSLPSDSTACDRFWRQLAGWLAAGHLRHPAWLLRSAVADPDQPFDVEFHLPPAAGIRAEEIQFAVEAPDGWRPLALAPTNRPGILRTVVTPRANESVRLVARRGPAVLAEAFLTGRAKPEGMEMRILTPDLVALQDLASASRGAVVGAEDDFDWENWLPPPPPPPVKVAEAPLWHSPWLFGALLGLLAVELVTRRVFRML